MGDETSKAGGPAEAPAALPNALRELPGEVGVAATPLRPFTVLMRHSTCPTSKIEVEAVDAAAATALALALYPGSQPEVIGE